MFSSVVCLPLPKHGPLYHCRETQAYHLSLLDEKPDYSDFVKPQEDVSNDAYLAQVLQYEFDREYDQQVNREEKLFNGNSKGRDSLLLYVSHCNTL